MTDQNFSHILPVAAPDPSPIGSLPADIPQLLAACRDRLAHGAAASFADCFASANDDLLGLADRATSVEHQQLYFAAMDFLTDRGQYLLRQFRSSYVEQFDAQVARLGWGLPHDAQGAPARLCLVDVGDFERDLAIGKLVARAACNCAEQLAALDGRLAALLGSARIDQDDNPLYPRALFAAVLLAFKALDVAAPLALTILQEFERQTAGALPALYDGLNRQLADCGIPAQAAVAMPCPLQFDESGDTQEEPQPSGPAMQAPEQPVAELPVGDSQAAAADTEVMGPSAVAHFEDAVFAQLAGAIAAATNRQGGRRTVRRSGRSFAPSLGLAQLIAALTSLQRGRADPRHLPELGAGTIDPGQSDLLQQLRATPMVKSSHPVDALTIDIVAMLFGAIFNDRDLPATLRAELARLQIPVLKVALMDKAFFSNKTHPARRLLDLIASAGVGRNEADAPRLMARIGRSVSDVVAGFEAEIDIFATQVNRLEDFLAAEDARAQTRTTAVVEKLAQRDREDLAQFRVATEIDARLAGPLVPALVGEFLDRHWRQVLVQTYVRSGDEGVRWVEALGTMDDLLWSVVPKHGAEARNRLLTSLPDLLRRLRVPLEAVGLEDAWDPFFGQLIRLHMGALHKDSPADTWEPTRHALPPVPAPAPAVGERRGLTATELVDSPHFIEYHLAGPQAATAQPADRKDRHLRFAQSLDVGAWVEFESFRGTRKTLRLNWVSQLRDNYLFTNRQGNNAITLAATSLAEHLRKGTARVLSQAPLTDRAVAQLLRGAAPVPVPASAQAAAPMN